MTLGTKLPEKFVDPLMGGVMNSPVKLPGSGKVCERKVIIGHLLRDSRDPFDSSPLSASDLVPCEELKEEIKEYNEKKVRLGGGTYGRVALMDWIWMMVWLVFVVTSLLL